MANINFEFPTDNGDLAKLLESIPKDWATAEGILRPDIELIESRRVIPNTGFGIIHGVFEYGKGYPVFFSVDDVAFEDAIDGEGPKRKRFKPKNDISGILFGNKLPSSIEFIEAGEWGEEEFQRAREVAISAVKNGYKGRLFFSKYKKSSFISGLSLVQYIANPNRCDTMYYLLKKRVEEGVEDLRDMLRSDELALRKAKQEGYKTEETLRVYYDEDRGGKYQDILPIVQRAIDLGIEIKKE